MAEEIFELIVIKKNIIISIQMYLRGAIQRLILEDTFVYLIFILEQKKKVCDFLKNENKLRKDGLDS